MSVKMKLATASSTFVLGLLSSAAWAQVAEIPYGISNDAADWSVDRADAATFGNVTWQGRGNVLKLSVAPPPNPADFYNWQGYQQRTAVPAGDAFLRGDMWIDPSWTSGDGTDYVRTGMWGSVLPAATVAGGTYVNTQEIFPIISFTNENGEGRLEIWDTAASTSGGWVDLPGTAGVINYGSWNTFDMRVLPESDSIEYYVNGTLIHTWEAPRNKEGTVSDQLWAMYLNARNNGETSFDTYWSQLRSGLVIANGGEIGSTPGDILLTGATGTATVTAGSIINGTVVVEAASGTTLTFGQDAGVSTSAAGAYGVSSTEGGFGILEDGAVSTSGARAHGLYAEGAGSGIGAYGTAIAVTGADAYGASANSGGIIALTGGSITTAGLRGYGLHAQKADDGMTGAGVITATNVTVATGGAAAVGGYAEQGGSLTINGGSVSTVGDLAYGLSTSDAGSLITSSANVTTQGDWTFGAYAVDGGAIALTGGTITTNALRAHGLLAERDGTITSGANVSTAGESAHGAVAGTNAGGGDIVLTGGTISTTGDKAYGLQAFRGSISGTATVSTTGAVAFGVAADGDGHISLTGGQVTTSGAGSHGLLANHDWRATYAGILDANVNVTTSGVDAVGAYAVNGGTINLTGGTIRTAGAGAHGLAAFGSMTVALGRAPAPVKASVTASNVTVVTTSADAAGLAIIQTGSISLTDSSVTSAGSAMAATMSDGATASFDVTGSTVTAGNGVLLDVQRDLAGDAGIVTARFAGGSVVTGNIRDLGAKNGGYTDVSLDGAELRGALSGVRTLSLTHGGIWSATGAAGVASLSIGTGGGVINTLASSVGIGGALTGSGALAKTGAGTLLITGDSRGFTGTTTIDAGTVWLTGQLASDVTINAAGTLKIGNDDATGDLTGATRNNGTLIFARSDDYDYTGALSGAGDLIKRGDGLLILSGTYTYTGTTTIQGGRVKVASELDETNDLVVDGGDFDLSDRAQEVASLSGTGGSISLGTTGALTVNQAGDSSFAGSLEGSGSFIKTGGGTLNLTGDSGFTGEASVDGGRLAVNGTLPGSVLVNAGGTLGGNGTVGEIVANAGGTVAPGNSIGTLNVTGDVAFGAGSVYAVEVDADGNSDKIIASGAANITGGTVSVLAAAGNYRWTSDYVILSAAGGINGEFVGTDVDLPFLTPSLAYGLNDITLTLVRNDRSFLSAGTTRNQRAVAGALDASASTGTLYRAVAGQADEASAARAFDTLSGEIWASTATLLVDQSRRSGELVLGRLQQADIVTRALAGQGSAARETRGGGTAIWGQAIGSSNRLDGNGNAAPVSQNQFGFITGLDTMVGPWRLGAAFGHGEAKIRVDQRASSATATTSTVAVYAGGGWGNLRLHVGGSYGWHDIDGRRDVTFPGFMETVTANSDDKSLSGFAELSYAAQFGRATIEPFAGVNHVYLKGDPFTETGGSAALAMDGGKRNVTFTTLGLRAGTAMPVSERAVVTPRLSAAWQHGFGDVAASGTGRLASGASFSIEGLPLARNAVLLEAGAQANIVPGGSLSLSYTGNIANRWSDHGLKIGFSYGF